MVILIREDDICESFASINMKRVLRERIASSQLEFLILTKSSGARMDALFVWSVKVEFSGCDVTPERSLEHFWTQQQ